MFDLNYPKILINLFEKSGLDFTYDWLNEERDNPYIDITLKKDADGDRKVSLVISFDHQNLIDEITIWEIEYTKREKDQNKLYNLEANND